MGRKAYLPAILILTGALALAAFYTTLRHHREALSGGTLVIAALPDQYKVEGEVVSGGTWNTLTATESGSLSSPENPEAVTLRVHDAHRHFYDIAIGRTIILSGLTPKTPVSVTSGETVFYNAVPSDWTGRIVLDTPRTAPFDIIFSQNDQTYRLGILRQIGGAA